MWKFEKGDSVRIKPDFAKLSYSGSPGVNEDMMQYAGCILTIVARHFSGPYRYNVAENYWVWDERWMEPALQISEEDFMEMLCNS